ncbi:hypothetical protein ABZ885_37965, partial [Kitasatospora sp. NPDC047058]
MPNPQPAVSRRTVVGAIGATAAALAVAPATSAAAAPAGAPSPTGAPATAPGTAGRARTVSVPATRAQSAAGGEAATVRPGFPIRYVGVSWDGPARGASIRLHGDGGAPGTWRPLPA